MSSIEEEVKHLQIPLQEFWDATEGFSDQHLLGRGGYGKVYKGVSFKHGNIAIKMLDPGQGQGDKEFRTEIALLSVYKHENIVSLLGFCNEDGQKILVYKYESNGSLDKHLKSTDLTWIQRLRICLDAACGIQYLHDDVETHRRILHRDVKSSNILLDENWKAKISDFGLSRMGPANIESTFLISRPCGTFGYVDPEYTIMGYLTQKSDVYSFGVVLFEVLCGRLARVTEYDEDLQFLTVWVQKHYKRQTVYKIIHPDLRKQIKTASFLTFSSIAYQCLKNGNERPTMKKVVEQLQKALDNQLEPSGSWSDDDGFGAHLQGRSAGLLASYSESSPASSPVAWKYDVFISYIGEDTRKTFVDHLYSALVDRHIFTYKEDESIKGKSIHPSLIKTIQESRIAIIVFSRSYISSSWCLDELALIMQNRDESGRIVIPIFHDVEPAEVRSQTVFYGEGSSKHEVKNNNKVEFWREALAKAADLSGWHVANGHESKFITKICHNISYRLLSLMPRSEASVKIKSNTGLIGIERRVKDLTSLLEVGSGGVHMVGICGMWGSGKTTLASSIYDEISHEFEGCCFVENVRAESRMHGLQKLQEKILSNVLKSKVMLSSIEHGIYMMQRRLGQNSILIILDDVDHIDHLIMLARSKSWFGKGSLIIFTTRNQDLANAHDAITHSVRMLDDIESIELFSRHAFGKSKPIQGFEDVSLNMVSKFGGHPSALISLGSYLHGKDMSEWMNIWDRLEPLSVAEIMKKFKIRDDGVVRDIDQCFRDRI